MLNELGISRSDAVKYTLLPQILPRLFRLFSTGFRGIPFYIALVLNTVRIIPNNHPALKPNAAGNYSLLKVLAAAADNLVFDLKNIDKITIFFTILIGIVLIIVQLIICVAALFVAPSYAYSGPGLGPRTLGEFFNNDTPNTDIAFRILDYVFGVPGIFTSNFTATPFHAGLHALLGFYSFGILLVGTFVIIYLVTTIVLETAQSGTPFGERFNKAWAPVRLILFFGLLLPTGNGINAAQYILLNAAKYGSNLATNGWLLFDRTVRGPYVANAEQLIAEPQIPVLQDIGAFMTVARTCSWAEGRIESLDIRPYIVFGAGEGGSIEMNGAPAFVDLVSRAQGGTIFIRYGEKSQEKYPTEAGAVLPYCGELSLTIVDQAQPGAAYMQQAYLALLGCLWNGNSGGIGTCPDNLSMNDFGRDFTSSYSTVLPRNPYPDMTRHVGSIPKTLFLSSMSTFIQEALTEAMQRQRVQDGWINDPVLQLGWAGAGIWFNKIAEQNGAVTAAVLAVPNIRRMPQVMEYIHTEKKKEDTTTPITELYTPNYSSGKPVIFEVPEQREVALVLNQAYKYWATKGSATTMENIPESKDNELSGNIIIDTMNVFLGTRGLFDMCKNTDIHPLAQLSSVGRAMVEHAISAFAAAAGFGVGAGIAAVLDKYNISQVLQSASGFFITFAIIGLMMGVLLYYVLPFLPFIYFFFAVMTWVKGIFEAMVAMPLWALGHLRIDGEGVPGDGGAMGYYYILEIFLRPVCIILGFLGGITIFTALVKVLHSIFYLLISNLAGHNIDPNTVGAFDCFTPEGEEALGNGAGGEVSQLEMARGTVDQFFYTVVYAIIVYMMALPCFKLVDLVPDNIMRWVGSGVKSFGAGDGDPAQGLMTNVAAGGYLIGGNIQNVGQGLSSSLKAKNQSAKARDNAPPPPAEE
ncbi:MAG: hypothetical protein DI551_08020 [Micavibrio aeruginosavorus]|uniref:Type IV secretion protein DotA n=1 Tax=Micavibrio aeruginosavorus TaxID=349221 RepID=A0A2W5N332_9BACT|nr:MAG: hypothetical protein DI551_08020 [Micavibrio aeruginosavorus]